MRNLNRRENPDSYFTLGSESESTIGTSEVHHRASPSEVHHRASTSSMPIPNQPPPPSRSLMSSLSFTPNTPTYQKVPDWYGNTEGRYMLANFGTFGKKKPKKEENEEETQF